MFRAPFVRLLCRESQIAKGRMTSLPIRHSFSTPAFTHHRPNFNVSDQDWIRLYTYAFATICAIGIVLAPTQDFDDLDCQSYCNQILCDGNCPHDEMLPGHEYH
jgi:hypothetical protein